MPRIMYILRTSPTWMFHDDVAKLDDTLKLALESILNVHLNEAQWTQAALPIPFAAEAFVKWSSFCQGTEPPSNPATQRGWDDILCKKVVADLLSEAIGSDLARLKAASRAFHREHRLRSTAEAVPSLDLKAQEPKLPLSKLRLELSDRDQELLLNDIEISSVPESHGENVMHLVTTLGQKLGVELTEHDIVDAMRVGRAPQLEEGVHGPAARPRPLVERLARRAVRDRLLQAARVRRGITTEGAGIPGRTCRLYVNERLTPQNRRLLYKARELKQQYSWRYVWTRDGKIFARQQAGTSSPRYRIRTEVDLERVFGR
ncbi:uncharacterized protein LOC134746915 [Cydia strobilella]|uniref:uncharacterized protein LOC134746915 n=1 Tax=Cydia strobilella TaxID=1100964 RepID=UPI0030075477